MLFKKKRQKKSEEGQAVIEFAFILPIFLLLVFGIIDFGWLFYNQISVENAARNAAREACVDYLDIAVDNTGTNPSTAQFPMTLTTAEASETPTATQTLLIDTSKSLEKTLLNNKDNVKMTVTYSTDDDGISPKVSNRPKGDVTVTLQCDMKVLTPLLGIFSDNMSRTLTSTSTYKVETHTYTTETTTTA